MYIHACVDRDIYWNSILLKVTKLFCCAHIHTHDRAIVR